MDMLYYIIYLKMCYESGDCVLYKKRRLIVCSFPCLIVKGVNSINMIISLIICIYMILHGVKDFNAL